MYEYILVIVCTLFTVTTIIFGAVCQHSAQRYFLMIFKIRNPSFSFVTNSIHYIRHNVCWNPPLYSTESVWPLCVLASGSLSAGSTDQATTGIVSYSEMWSPADYNTSELQSELSTWPCSICVFPFGSLTPLERSQWWCVMSTDSDQNPGKGEPYCVLMWSHQS